MELFFISIFLFKILQFPFHKDHAATDTLFLVLSFKKLGRGKEKKMNKLQNLIYNGSLLPHTLDTHINLSKLLQTLHHTYGKRFKIILGNSLTLSLLNLCMHLIYLVDWNCLGKAFHLTYKPYFPIWATILCKPGNTQNEVLLELRDGHTTVLRSPPGGKFWPWGFARLRWPLSRVIYSNGKQI